MNNTFENKLHALAQQTFDAQLNEIDDRVLKRLKESRELALSNIKYSTKKNVEISFPGWLSFASAATAFASISVIFVSLYLQPDLKQQSITTPLDDIALLSSDDELDFYENLDFYIWLEDENNAS